jgi:ribosomal protein S18 acetylase RimI-like enzyme
MSDVPALSNRIYRTTRAAFYEYGSDVPPPGAMIDTPRDVEEDLNAGSQALLAVLGDSGRVAGVVRWRVTKGQLHFHRLAVIPSERRKGVASALLKALITEAERQRCTSIACDVRIGVSRNVALYEKFGFVRTGERIVSRGGFTVRLGVMSLPLNMDTTEFGKGK